MRTQFGVCRHDMKLGTLFVLDLFRGGALAGVDERFYYVRPVMTYSNPEPKFLNF